MNPTSYKALLTKSFHLGYVSTIIDALYSFYAPTWAAISSYILMYTIPHLAKSYFSLWEFVTLWNSIYLIALRLQLTDGLKKNKNLLLCVCIYMYLAFIVGWQQWSLVVFYILSRGKTSGWVFKHNSSMKKVETIMRYITYCHLSKLKYLHIIQFMFRKSILK